VDQEEHSSKIWLQLTTNKENYCFTQQLFRESVVLAYLLFEQVVTIHCLATQNLGAGVEQPLDCLTVQNRQDVESMERSMDWTLENKIVDGLFFSTCADLAKSSDWTKSAPM